MAQTPFRDEVVTCNYASMRAIGDGLRAAIHAVVAEQSLPQNIDRLLKELDQRIQAPATNAVTRSTPSQGSYD